MFYSECAVTTPSSKARNLEISRRLWDESVKMVGWTPNENFIELLTAAARDIAPEK